MSELYAIEKSTLDSIGSAVRGIKDQVGSIPVSQLAHEINTIATFTVNGEKVLESKTFEMEEFDIYKSSLPNGVFAMSAVVLRGDLYIIGYDGTDYTYMYKFDGETWVWNEYILGSRNDTYGHAVVFEDAIYVLAGQTLKKWDGNEWSNVANLYNTYRDPQVIGEDLAVFNGEIHILGSPYSGYHNVHYKYDGTDLVEVGTDIPAPSSGVGKFITYNNQIHMFVNIDHYKWDGSSWTKVSTTPFNFGFSEIVVKDNEIHVLGGGAYSRKHYKWNGRSWTALNDLPIHLHQGTSAVLNGSIHIIGSMEDTTYGLPAHGSHIELGAKRYTEVSA